MLPAALGLVLVLLVVLVSAAIRLNAAFVGELVSASGLSVLRGVHRTSASLAVLAALWLAWTAWRMGEASRTPVGIVLALTVLLSLLGIVAGKTPTPAQALGNMLGGFALAAAFAWLLGAAYRDGTSFTLAAFLALGGMLALQTLIGARLSIFGRSDFPALPLHAMLGLGAAALLAWLALARIGGREGRLLFALALAAPLAGFTALQYEYSAAAALVHAASAALLAAGAAFTLSRNA